MRTVYVYNDVPDGLMRCIRMIDYSKIPRNDLQRQLLQLEALALQKSRRMVYRVPGPPPMKAVTVPAALPDEAVTFINKFFYGNLFPTETSIAEGVIKSWIRRNLPTVEA